MFDEKRHDRLDFLNPSHEEYILSKELVSPGKSLRHAQISQSEVFLFLMIQETVMADLTRDTEDVGLIRSNTSTGTVLYCVLFHP